MHTTCSGFGLWENEVKVESLCLIWCKKWWVLSFIWKFWVKVESLCLFSEKNGRFWGSFGNLSKGGVFMFCLLVCMCGFWRYQLELCQKALEENIIVYLETGCGKTHIAVLLMYELRHLILKPQKNICVFLAPTVALVQQVMWFSMIWNMTSTFQFRVIFKFEVEVRF